MKNNNNTLYDIGADMTQLNDYISSLGGDVSDPEVEVAIDAYLLDNKERLAEKLEGYGSLMRSKAGTGQARKERAEELAKLGKQDLGLVDKLKERVTEFFKTHKLKTVETDSFKFNLQGSGGLKPLKIADSVLEDPQGELPKKYVRMVPQINTDLLRADLEAGKAKGLEGKAWLGERGQHLTVK